MSNTSVRVLVIDDNKGVLEDYKKILIPKSPSDDISGLEESLFGGSPAESKGKNLDVVFHCATQGQEGYEMVCKASLSQHYDVVFIDMRMPPGWDGLQTIKEIWKVDPNQFVVLCTAYSDYSFDDMVRELGMRSNFLILHKPFEPEEILQIVQSIAAKTTQKHRDDRRLATQLSKAIENEELSLAFQPILDISTGEIWAFEALCRWVKDGKAVSSPDEFIRVAEEFEIISALGNWVVNEAMRSSKHFETVGKAPVRVTINVSPLQLEPGFPDALSYMLKVHQLRADSIGLEVTESRMLEKGSEAEGIINSLKDLGFHMLLDDFGSGYSNLLGLASMAFETLKVDRLFCAGMHTSACTIPIVKSVIDVAKGLGKNCIVEGIESVQQESTLRDIGCKLVQGFLYSPPISFEKATDWVRQGKKPQSQLAA